MTPKKKAATPREPDVLPADQPMPSAKQDDEPPAENKSTAYPICGRLDVPPSTRTIVNLKQERRTIE